MKKIFKSRSFIRVIIFLLFACIMGTAMSLLFTNNRKNMAQAALSGAGTKLDPVKIYSASDFQELATRVNNGTDTYYEKYVKVMNDIDMSTISNWTPIGNTATQAKTFQGHFDGNNKTISNLTINATANYAGLFGYTTGATIENVKISNPSISSTKQYVGALVGYYWTGNVTVNKVATLRKGEIKNCHLTGGSVKSTVSEVGGLIGYVNAAGATDHEVVISNLTVKGTGTNSVPTQVQGTSNIGGIIGYATGLAYKALTTGEDQAGVYISTSSSTATVTVNSGIGGGILGHAQGTLLEQCYTTGAIRSLYYGTLGGIIGQIDGKACKVSDCFETGDVSGVGLGTGNKAANGHTYAGGIVGIITGINGCYVQNCLVTGNVLVCSPWAWHEHDKYDRCLGLIYSHGAAGGIVGVNSGKNTKANIGGCAVASRQVSGLSNRATSIYIHNEKNPRSNYAIALSSPFANGWADSVYPAMIPDTKNIYNKDMCLSEQRFLAYKTCTSIEGDKVDGSAFKVQATYEDLGWQITGGKRIWGIGKSFNNGYPYLSNCYRGNVVEYPYGSVYNPILINNEADFAQMRDNCNNGGEWYGGLYLKQTADLDMTDMGMVGSSAGAAPVTEYRNYSFRGNYDGNMFRMKNVSIISANSNMGIFATVMNASFKNIIVENPLVNNETVGNISNAGILVGVSYGNLYMDNCAIMGGRLAVPKMNVVGALVGSVARTGNYITRCFSSATVIGGTGVGGLIGVACGLHISQSYCVGDVENRLSTWSQKANGYSYVGLSRSTGGLIGELYRPYGGFSSSTSGSTVTYKNSTLTDAKTYAYDESLTATPSTNTSYSTIDNCYASGTITDYSTGNYNNAAGGIVGRAMGEAVISNCYFNGELKASGTGTAATVAENVGAIVGLTDATIIDVYINNCLSAIKSASLTVAAAAKISVAGYYNTYTSRSVAAPQAPVNCFYVPVTDMPVAITTGGGGAVDGGTATTLADISAGTIFTGDNSLGWDMTDTWTLRSDLNGGFPMLKGLIVDTTELNAAIAEARTFDGANFSEETFSALTKLLDSANKEIVERTITEDTKVQYAEAIRKAIENLRPDTSALKELYDRVNKDMMPYKDFYVSFTLVDSLLPGAKEILENSENFYNNDVKSVYDALKLAVDNLRIDKTELNKAIEKANAIMLNASSYPDSDIKNLDAALKNAVKVNNDDTVLAPQVNNATKNLQEALEKMTLDKTELLNQIVAAYANIGVVVRYDVAIGDTQKTIIIDNDDNRVLAVELVNYAEFEKALNAAVAVLQNAEAPSQTILNAQFDLDLAQNALKLKTDKLQELSSQAAALLINEKYYTADSITKLKDAKAVADGIINATASTDTLVKRRDDYDAACKNLTDALNPEPNKTELLQVINKAKAENKNELYTDETFNKLQEEITKAQAVYDNANATVKEIYAAISALNDALQNLDISLDYLKDLIKQARYILDNDAIKALYTTGIDDLQDKTAKSEELCNTPANEVNVSDVKTLTRLLEAALNALTVSKDEMDRYIRMALTDYADDYIKDGVYTEESTLAFRELAQQARDSRDSMTDADVVSYTVRLKTAYDSLKANSDELSSLVARLSAMSNKKYRQDNDGKWIVDESTGNMKIFVIYEEKSWKALETELDKAKELLLNVKATPAQINDSIAALKAAEAGLIVDTSELEMRMEKAVALLAQEDLYKSESLAALQTAYDAAKALLDGAEESGDKLVMSDVQARLDALVFAIGSMEADLDAITRLLRVAENLFSYKQYFTSVTVANLESNYKQVNSLVEKGAELDASSVALLSQMLTDAMKNLVINTEELQRFVDLYTDLKTAEEYIAGFDTFSSLIATHKALLRKNALRITTYTEATDMVTLYSVAVNELQAALNDFTPNWTAYEALVNEGKDILSKATEGTDTSALETALDDADAILTDKTATYEGVVASVRSLKTALKALKALELEQLIHDIKEEMASAVIRLDEASEVETSLSDYYGDGATVADAYTVASYKALQAALRNGETVLKISNVDYDQVESAITAIEKAREALVVETGMLKELISECDTLYLEEYYEATSYATYKTALDGAKTFIAGETIALTDYINNCKLLVTAINGLVYEGDALDKLITLAESTLAAESANCTENSVKALTDSIAFAKEFKAGQHSDKTNDEVCAELLAAIAGLVNVVKLNEQIALVQPFVDFGNPDKDGNYFSEGSFNELVDTLNKAKALLDKEGLMQYEADNAVARLTGYAEGILLNVTEAKKYVDEQNAFISKNKGRYTDETWNPYTKAVNDLGSEIKLSKYETTPEKISQLMATAQAAQQDLEEDLSRIFFLKETNTTFKFLHGDFTEVENFETHQYNAETPVYLTNLAVNDTIADILTQFDNTDVKVFNTKGEEITDFTQVIATGMVLRIMAGEQVLDEITLVVKGDINGDGRVTATDKSQLNAYTGGKRQLEGAFLLAGDINGDGKVTATDKSQLNAYTNNKRNIFEGLSVKAAA